MFLGYASKSKRHFLWCLDFKKVIQSRDVTFNESSIFSHEKEFTITSTTISHQCDTSNKVKLEVPT